MSETLKPCAHCGGEAREKWFADKPRLAICCSSCGVRTAWHEASHGGSPVDDWNRRYIDTASAHIDAAIAIVDSDMFKALMAVDRIGKCAEIVATAIAEAEARGLKRAAEIARKDEGVNFEDGNIVCWRLSSKSEIAERILSAGRCRHE